MRDPFWRGSVKTAVAELISQSLEEGQELELGPLLRTTGRQRAGEARFKPRCGLYEGGKETRTPTFFCMRRKKKRGGEEKGGYIIQEGGNGLTGQVGWLEVDNCLRRKRRVGRLSESRVPRERQIERAKWVFASGLYHD